MQQLFRCKGKIPHNFPSPAVTSFVIFFRHQPSAQLMKKYRLTNGKKNARYPL